MDLEGGRRRIEIAFGGGRCLNIESRRRANRRKPTFKEKPRPGLIIDGRERKVRAAVVRETERREPGVARGERGTGAFGCPFRLRERAADDVVPRRVEVQIGRASCRERGEGRG